MKILSNDLDKSRNTRADVSYFSTNPGNSHSRKYFLHELLQAPSDHGASANVFITYLNHLIEELTFLFSKRILLS